MLVSSASASLNGAKEKATLLTDFRPCDTIIFRSWRKLVGSLKNVEKIRAISRPTNWISGWPDCQQTWCRRGTASSRLSYTASVCTSLCPRYQISSCFQFMSRLLLPQVASRNQSGVRASGILTVGCVVLAGANSRGLFHRPEYKAGLLGSSQHPGHNRMLSQTDELGMRKGVAFNKRFGGVKEILSTAPKEHKPLWCIAKDYANPDLILSSLNWACSKSGGGVDCKPVQPNGSCFQPDTLHNHASYAFNMYYQKHGFAPETCDFDGAATVTSTDPSKDP